MLPGEKELEQIVATVWTTMFGLEVEPDDAVVSNGPACHWTGCVRITGAWEGAVVLRCPASLARHAAGEVFGMGSTAVTVEQIGDLMGELTNIIAGNFKALLPEVSHLSLPAVTECTDDASPLDGRLLARAGFRARGEAFTLHVFEGAVCSRSQPALSVLGSA
jgi:chemotaxis protein CheX